MSYHDARVLDYTERPIQLASTEEPPNMSSVSWPEFTGSLPLSIFSGHGGPRVLCLASAGSFAWGGAMTDEAYRDERQGLTGKLRGLTGGARDIARAALKEAMAWDAYKWTVLALLTAIFLLVALSYGGIRSELAALKQDRGVSAQDLAAVRTGIGTEISDLKAGLAQSMSDMKSGLGDSIAKITAKLDARSQQPKPAAPSPKPAVKPRPQ